MKSRGWKKFEKLISGPPLVLSTRQYIVRVSLKSFEDTKLIANDS